MKKTMASLSTFHFMLWSSGHTLLVFPLLLHLLVVQEGFTGVSSSSDDVSNCVWASRCSAVTMLWTCLLSICSISFTSNWHSSIRCLVSQNDRLEMGILLVDFASAHAFSCSWMHPSRWHPSRWQATFMANILHQLLVGASKLFHLSGCSPPILSVLWWCQSLHQRLLDTSLNILPTVCSGCQHALWPVEPFLSPLHQPYRCHCHWWLLRALTSFHFLPVLQPHVLMLPSGNMLGCWMPLVSWYHHPIGTFPCG